MVFAAASSPARRGAPDMAQVADQEFEADRAEAM
jgi:hypothetical protein